MVPIAELLRLHTLWLLGRELLVLHRYWDNLEACHAGVVSLNHDLVLPVGHWLVDHGWLQVGCRPLRGERSMGAHGLVNHVGVRQEDGLLGLDSLLDLNLVLGSDLALVSFDSDPTASFGGSVGAGHAWLSDSFVTLITMVIRRSPDFVETPPTSTFEEYSCSDSVQKCQNWALITNESTCNESHTVVMDVNRATGSEAFSLPNREGDDTSTPDEVPGKAVSQAHLCEDVMQSEAKHKN